MLRKVAVVVAVVALALPNLAAAQQPPHPGGKPPPGRPGPAPRAVVPHGGPPGGPRGAAVVVRPGGPGPGAFHGRPFNRVHLAPFLYPPGFGYRRWVVGGILPPLFLTSAYFYGDYAALGLAPPEPGFQWVRYGPDLLLVNVATGQVVDVVYGAFY